MPLNGVANREKKRLCCVQSYRVSDECTQADCQVKSSVFTAACGSPKADLAQVLLGQSGHESEVNKWQRQTSPATVSRVRVLRLFDWPKTRDKDVHESLGVLPPVSAERSRMLA